MDISRLTHGIKLVLGASVAYFIVSFFNWFKVGDIGVASGWSGIGFLAALLALAIVVWEGLRLANINLEIGMTPAMVTAGLAVLLVVFAFIRFITTPGPGAVDSIVDRTFWAWIGVLLAIFVVVGAFMNMKDLGHSLEDMGNEMKAAAGSAAAAAKAATDKDDESVVVAPEAPAAPEAPVAPNASAGEGEEPSAPPHA